MGIAAEVSPWSLIDRVVARARLPHVRRDISVREFFRKRICVYTVTQIIWVTRLSREQVEKEIEELLEEGAIRRWLPSVVVNVHRRPASPFYMRVVSHKMWIR